MAVFAHLTARGADERGRAELAPFDSCPESSPARVGARGAHQRDTSFHARGLGRKFAEASDNTNRAISRGYTPHRPHG